VILRGDFAVELNRIPWLKSRDAEYQPSAVSCSPDEGTSCAPGPAAPLPMIDPPPLGPMAACTPRFGAGGAGPVSQVGYHNEPRFHPVPTRPVFSQRGDLGGLVPRGPLPLPRPFGVAPQGMTPLEPEATRLEPPTAPEPEAIPTPPPVPKADSGKATSSASSVPAWIFTPPSRTEQAASDPSSSHTTADGSWATRR